MYPLRIKCNNNIMFYLHNIDDCEFNARTLYLHNTQNYQTKKQKPIAREYLKQQLYKILTDDGNQK